MQELGVAIVSRDVEPVVAVGGGIADVKGPLVDTELEGLIGLRVERSPVAAVVGALELPVLRIALGDEGGADDRVALDDLRGVHAEVILQPAGRPDVEPERVEVVVEGARGVGLVAGVVVGGAAGKSEVDQRHGRQSGVEFGRIATGAGGVFGAGDVVVGGAGAHGCVHVAGLVGGQIAGDDGVAAAGGGRTEQVIGGGAEGRQPAQGDGLVRARGEHGGGRSRGCHEASGPAGVGQVGEGGGIGRRISA